MEDRQTVLIQTVPDLLTAKWIITESVLHFPEAVQELYINSLARTAKMPVQTPVEMILKQEMSMEHTVLMQVPESVFRWIILVMEEHVTVNQAVILPLPQ